MGPRKKSKSQASQTSGDIVISHEDGRKRTVKGQLSPAISQAAKSSSGSSTSQPSALAHSPPATSPEICSRAKHNVDNDKANHDTQRRSPPRNSWYVRTWPRLPKSSAVTQIVKESVSAAGLSASEASAKAGQAAANVPKPNTSTTTFARTVQVPKTTPPKNPITTEIPATPALSVQPSDSQITSPPGPVPLDPGQRLEIAHAAEPEPTDSIPTEPKVPQLTSTSIAKSLPHAPDSSSSWLAWLSATTATAKGSPHVAPVTQLSPVPSVLEQNNPPSKVSQRPKETQCLPLEQGAPVDASLVASVSPAGQRRSWLTFWNKSSDSRLELDNQSPSQNPLAGEGCFGAKQINAVPTVRNVESQSGNLGSWGFWQRSKQPQENGRADKSLADDEIATTSITATSKRVKSFDSSKVASGKELTPNAPSAQQTVPPDLTTPKTSQITPKPNTAHNSTSTAAVVKVVPSKLRLQTPTTPPRLSGPSNILLPQLRDVFSSAHPSRWMQTFSRYFSYNREPVPKHVDIVQETPRLRKAIAIGIHGYFPAPLIRTILGQPTGTSVKFADMAENAIQRWTMRQGYLCDVAKVALEGEGRIGDRVDLLWTLMLNWLDDIRKADFVFVACHSQGVPVALMLIAKLISFGCINGARIAVCAMAGVNLGPFPEYKSRWIGGAAGELFEFANLESPVSRDYIAALGTTLGFGVKIAYVGSIDDQLVSLEVSGPAMQSLSNIILMPLQSSTFCPLRHPHVFRAVFVNGRVHAPDFLTHLVGFILKIRNLGVSDHGLIRELSSPLAGSLYSGEGHSKIYDEPAVYEYLLTSYLFNHPEVLIKPQSCY